MDGVDPTAIFKLGVSVVPMHHYTAGYAGKLNENGVELSSKAFMDHLKTKNDQPLGAGPYVFKEYKDKVVTYEANESFMLGSPKIKTFRYQEITLGAELIPSRPERSTTPIRRHNPPLSMTLPQARAIMPNSAISWLTMTVTATSVFRDRLFPNLRCVRLWLTP